MTSTKNVSHAISHLILQFCSQLFDGLRHPILWISSGKWANLKSICTIQFSMWNVAKKLVCFTGCPWGVASFDSHVLCDDLCLPYIVFPGAVFCSSFKPRFSCFSRSRNNNLLFNGAAFWWAGYCPHRGQLEQLSSRCSCQRVLLGRRPLMLLVGFAFVNIYVDFLKHTSCAWKWSHELLGVNYKIQKVNSEVYVIFVESWLFLGIWFKNGAVAF